MKADKTRYCSFKCGRLADGCTLCVKGRKLVLFITGLCSSNCYFCPLSDTKKNKDDVWANERKVKHLAEIIEEAKLNKATGAGITGGDPFIRLDRTLKAIRMLKKNFSNFHIHLYAPLNLITLEKINRLAKAGLDEIRFHPNLDNKKQWNKLEILDQIKIAKGIEVPVIPGREKELKKLINLVCNKADFINLNELEISDNNANKLVAMGFRTKGNMSYAVAGSEALGLKLLRYCAKKNFNAHYCTATLKDRVQLGNRIKLRAKSIAKTTDIITREGMLKRGAIYLPELVPGFGYRKRLETLKSRGKYLYKLREGLIRIKKLQPGVGIVLDTERMRLLASVKDIKKLKDEIKELGLVPAMIIQYPTHDQTEIEVGFL